MTVIRYSGGGALGFRIPEKRVSTQSMLIVAGLLDFTRSQAIADFRHIVNRREPDRITCRQDEEFNLNMLLVAVQN